MCEQIVVLDLPIVTPSQNEWDKWHWTRQEKWKQDCQFLLRSAVNKAGGRSRMPNRFEPSNAPDKVARRESGEGVPVKIQIWSKRHGKLDRANLIGGCKGLIDCLVKEGVLLDDSEDWISDSYVQEIDRQNKCTIVTLGWTPLEKEGQPSLTRQLCEKKPTEEGEQEMLKLSNEEAKVARIEVRSAVPPGNEVDEPQVKARVHIELPLEEKNIRAIPFVANAVKAILKASKGVEEGPNSYSITIKRDFGHASYDFSLGEYACSFSGEVALRPKVAIVEGVVAVSWKVDCEMDLADLAALAAMVQMDSVLLSTSLTQKVIPFEGTSQSGNSKKRKRSNG